MSEFAHNSSNNGIDMHQMPELSQETTIGEVLSHFRDKLTGKTLTMHFAVGGEEDIVRSSTIGWSGVLEDGKVALLTDDALGQPNMIEFDSNSTNFSWSIYEANDLWFQDKTDDRLWWGIYDEPLAPAYLRLEE